MPIKAGGAIGMNFARRKFCAICSLGTVFVRGLFWSRFYANSSKIAFLLVGSKLARFVPSPKPLPVFKNRIHSPALQVPCQAEQSLQNASS
jgi:hypothetical protein